MFLPVTANAQTNPCQPGSDVAFNPTRFAIISLDHNSTALTQYRFEIKKKSDFSTVQEIIFLKSVMLPQGSNCFLSPVYTLNDVISKDGTTEYISRYRAESSNETLNSDWSDTSIPFVLASKLRVGAILVK